MDFIGQQLNGQVEVQPTNVLKDSDLLNRLKKAFLVQIREIKRKAIEVPRHGELALVEPAIPMSGTKETKNDNNDEKRRKVQHKKGRKTTTKLILELPFSFKPPTFCLEKKIDLEKVLLSQSREGASRGNYVQNLSVEERLQNWMLEKRKRCKDETKDGISIIDYYYHHLPSKLKLRSQPEVINFLIHGDFPLKDGSKKEKIAEVDVVHNQVRSSHFLEIEIVNKMMSSHEKDSSELNNKVMSDELNSKINFLEKEIMSPGDKMWLNQMVDNEIENEMMIQELLNQPGELLFLSVEKK